MEILWTILGKTLGKIFPAKTVSSFLGIGYLPGWQNYWSSFLILLIAYITLILTYGGNFILYKMPGSGIIVAATFMKLAVVMLVLQLVGISIFHIQNPSASSGENIVIQMASGQVLTVALSMPAIMSIYYTVSNLYGNICKQILQCPFWFNDFMHLFFFFTIPYIFFNVVESMKPWPISSIQLSYNNAISITLEGIFYTFYAVILLYSTAFIFCDLTMHNAIILNKSIIQYMKESSAALGDYLHNTVKKISIE
ncbi:phosphatidylglycerophosphatase [Wolbachia endosymbiont of Litomosoides brasiliensis]|uniref:phosphatidylglycerophosphatase n=1 Tax=Wolbachia endosymbiont of Litomosoides brasiliensis TaxID=1812117 RepID=UPI00158CF757|nr:phosphatidylglycerophosphatase [Wolbachia endosymbiont of Litomosoides brasiliensis]NUY39734.1 phosphatidylglycerophosphatase [Wolbachia endosymbiont of Litomosoides brasiliensis]